MRRSSAEGATADAEVNLPGMVVQRIAYQTGYEEGEVEVTRTLNHTHNLPTIIAGPPIGARDADDLPADVLPVWPERSELHRMEAEAFGDLLETLSQAHCPGQRVLTA